MSTVKIQIRDFEKETRVCLDGEKKVLLFLFSYIKIKNNGGYDDEKNNNWNIYIYCIYFYFHM